MTKEFRLHAFVCTNQRDPSKPRECCAAKKSLDVMTRLKRAARAAGIHDVRVNKAGCLDRCSRESLVSFIQMEFGILFPMMKMQFLVLLNTLQEENLQKNI